MQLAVIYIEIKNRRKYLHFFGNPRKKQKIFAKARKYKEISENPRKIMENCATK